MTQKQQRLTIGAVAVFATTLLAIFIEPDTLRLALTAIVAGVAGYLVPLDA